MASGISECPQCRDAFDQVFEIDWSRNPLDPRNFGRATRRVQAVAEDGAYDLVHCHTPVAAFVSRYALRHLRRRGKPKVIYTAHGFHFHRGGSALTNGLFLALEKCAGRWTDDLVVINREDEEAATRRRIVPPDRVHYMPGIGIALEAYSAQHVPGEAVRRVREELRLGAPKVLFLMVAEFNSGKRHGDALHALARVGRKDTVLAFAGAGRLEPEMKALAQRLGIAEQVRFLGVRWDIPVLIRASRATILPSEREGLPRSLMESLALGVPVIAADARGSRDLLAHGGGLLVPVGDVKGFAEAITYLLDHPEESERMGEVGRKQMEPYDLSNILRLHEALYAEALGLGEVHAVDEA